MANVSITTLDSKIKALNEWIDNHHSLDPQYQQKTHSRNYHVAKRIEMDEYDLKTIEI